MFRFPWGDFHSLNLGWFLQKFNELREDWATAEAGIDGALDAEIQKAEDALTDVFAARDAAAASASAANSSALNASQSSLTSMDARDQSRAARDAAQQAATNAAASETAAGSSATAASNSAGAAATSATQAGQSATAAGNSATAAGQSATNAAASETAAGNSAEAAAASETAAGKSAADAEEAASSVEASAEQIEINKNDIAELKESINDIEPVVYAGFEQKSITNVPIASFDDGADDVPVKKLVVNITAVQDGTGVPSPYNMRPITGWTGCNIYQSGENRDNPTIIPISFPSEEGVIYGGTLNITTGELTIKQRAVTLSAITWEKYRNSIYVHANFISQYGSAATNNATTNVQIATAYSKNMNSPADLPNNTFRIFNDGGLYLRDDLYTTAEEFKNGVRGILVYTLTKPVTYTLTATEVKTLLNYNNIWADTGNINELIYRAMNNTDEKIRLVKALIAPTLNTMIADTALVVNDFRIVNNTLYRITAPVANGAILTPGTNCKATTVTAVLKTLLT